ncbi:MAG: hypothetical protein IKE55_03175 [Kiritimatiellae bacterium]|nr:hypothetical protein [Kiritimatiellia bacterium]
MPSAAFQLLRVAAVVALMCAAAALATPPGRLPLALRGVARLLRAGRRGGGGGDAEEKVPLWKKSVAFALVLAAAALCLVR